MGFAECLEKAMAKGRSDSLIVGNVEDQGDRVLIRDRDSSFYVIASHLQAAGVRPGDTVTYEPVGNFGWFVEASR